MIKFEINLKVVSYSSIIPKTSRIQFLSRPIDIDWANKSFRLYFKNFYSTKTYSFRCFLVQIFLGIPLEIIHGPLRLSGIYFAGVVSGSLLTSITNSRSYLAGASGGVYALLLAHLPTVIMNCREMKTFVEWIVR